MTPQDTLTRRQLIGSAVGVVGAAALCAGAAELLVADGRVAALSSAVTGPAGVKQEAERLGTTDKLAFPVDTDPRYGSLVCLNNFGGRSTANGACQHAGVDIGNDRGDGSGRPLLACVDGVVHKDEAFSSAGLTRILRDDSGTYYRYHHLDDYESSLNEGDAVVAGQVIGFMGATGNTSWPHLHFEVWLGSLTPRFASIVDPVPLLAFPQANVSLNKPTACGR